MIYVHLAKIECHHMILNVNATLVLLYLWCVCTYMGGGLEVVAYTMCMHVMHVMHNA